MVRKNESYLPAVNIASKDFCFFVFLKECEKNLKTRSVKNRKSKKTIRLIKDFLEKARLLGHVPDPTILAGSEYNSRS